MKGPNCENTFRFFVEGLQTIVIYSLHVTMKKDVAEVLALQVGSRFSASGPDARKMVTTKPHGVLQRNTIRIDADET